MEQNLRIRDFVLPKSSKSKLPKVAPDDVETAREYNTGNQIQKLPVELLQPIFLGVVEPGLDPGFIPKRLGRLFLVCRQWHTIIENTPQLWTHIKMAFHPAYIRKALELSKPLPLNIGWTGDTSEKSDDELRIMMQHAERWRSVNYSRYEDDSGSDAMDATLSVDTPLTSLREVRLMCVGSQVVELHAHLLSPHRLCIRNLILSFPSQWPALHFLSPLQFLRLEIAGFEPDIGLLLRLLENNSSSLECFCFKSRNLNRLQSVASPLDVCLPNLMRLELEVNSSWAVPLLDHMSCPTITRFTFNGIVHPGKGGSLNLADHPFLLRLCAFDNLGSSASYTIKIPETGFGMTQESPDGRSHTAELSFPYIRPKYMLQWIITGIKSGVLPTPKTIELQAFHVWYSLKDAVKPLEDLPSVQTLQVDQWDRKNDLSFLGPRDGGWLFPELTTLRLTGGIFKDPILKMLKHRRHVETDNELSSGPIPHQLEKLVIPEASLSPESMKEIEKAMGSGKLVLGPKTR